MSVRIISYKVALLSNASQCIYQLIITVHIACSWSVTLTESSIILFPRKRHTTTWQNHVTKPRGYLDVTVVSEFSTFGVFLHNLIMTYKSRGMVYSVIWCSLWQVWCIKSKYPDYIILWSYLNIGILFCFCSTKRKY